MFIKYSAGQIPPKKSRGKSSQGKKTADILEVDVDVSEDSDSEPSRKQTSSRKVIKKKVSIFADDNIIPYPDVALELGKSMSLTKVAKEEAARQVHATHERIVTKFDPEPARRRPLGISFRDTSGVSKKIYLDPSQNLKGVSILTPEEQVGADTMQALKASRKSSKSRSLTRGSSKGTGVSLGVLDESTVILATSSERTSTKPGVPDEEKVTSEANIILDWASEQESEYSEDDDDDDKDNDDNDDGDVDDDDDDDKSIDLEKTDDEETDDEFVYSGEYVQTDDETVHGDEQVNDDEDKEMTNVEDANTRNDYEEITDAVKAYTEKTEVVKDDTKKAKFPPSSSSDTTYVEINSLLDVKIQQEIPHIQSPFVLNVSVYVISEPSVLTPIPETPSLKEADNTTTLRASLKSKMPSAVHVFIGSSLGNELHKVLQRHTEELIQKYPQQIDYKEMIEESVQANLINKVKNQLPTLLPKAISDFIALVIQSTVKNALEKTSLLAAQYSSQTQPSIKVVESLSEYELKINLFDKMEKSRSYLTYDKHQDLYDDLFNSLSLDDAIANGQAYPKKVLRKRDHDNEDPSARPDQGKKTKRHKTKESNLSKKSQTSKESSKGKSPAKTSKSGKSMTTEEPVKEPVFKMASNDIEQTVNDEVNDAGQPHDDSTQAKEKYPKKKEIVAPFDLTKPLLLKCHPGCLTVFAEYFFNNDMEFLKSSDLEKNYTTSITKTKTARYEILGIKDMVLTLWSTIKFGYNKDVEKGIKHWGKKRQCWYRSQINKFSKNNVYSIQKILSVVSVKVKKLHGYGHLDEIVVKRADRQLYKFKEGDSIDLHLNDIEYMLLLAFQHKLFHLNSSDIVDFIVALRMFTRSLIIKRRVKYLQIGKRVMRVDELYKFSDGTLKTVRDELHHRILDFRLGYNKEMLKRK
ncbi:hypothetical protein Tco_1554165 [Tanacetum coccineum]